MEWGVLIFSVSYLQVWNQKLWTVASSMMHVFRLLDICYLNGFYFDTWIAHAIAHAHTGLHDVHKKKHRKTSG